MYFIGGSFAGWIDWRRTQMTWYWGKWSKYLQEKVAIEETRDPSSVTVVNKFYCTTTTTTKEYWSEEELIKNISNFFKLGCSTRTANVLDLMVYQRMGYDTAKLKAFVQKLRSSLPGRRLESTPEGLYLWSK